jgi:hypothetical protein
MSGLPSGRVIARQEVDEMARARPSPKLVSNNDNGLVGEALGGGLSTALVK